MGDIDRRRCYQYNHILIDSDRILVPQFSDAVVLLSGAQLEMLRNVSGYLNRRETYVKETELGYYMMPTTEDFDIILGIVADLEETLMGNPNVIWGYKDVFEDNASEIDVDPGYNTLEHTAVPAGYVYHLEAITVINSAHTSPNVRCYIRRADVSYYFHVFQTVVATVPQSHAPWLTLKEGDEVWVQFAGCVQDDNIYSTIVGYTMKVPE